MQSPDNSAAASRRMIFLLAGLALAVFAGSFLIGRFLNGRSRTATAPDVPADAEPVNPPVILSDFQLTGTDGEPIALNDLRGKLTVMFFGYTNCPDVCPTTMAEYAEVRRLLGSDADKVNLVFVSVDGARDTPERVGEWLGLFDAGLIGMTGTPEQLQPLGQKFGILYERVTIENGTVVPLPTEDHVAHAKGTAARNYFVNHTSPSFVIDPAGVLRYVYFYGTPASSIADGLRAMLRS